MGLDLAIVHYPKGSSTPDAELPKPIDYTSSKPLEIKSGNCNFKIPALDTFGAVSSLPYFRQGDTIQFYASQTNLNRTSFPTNLGVDNLLANMIVDTADYNLAGNKKFWSIGSSDKTKLFYNFLWSFSYSTSDGWKIWNTGDANRSIIKNIVDRINFTYNTTFTYATYVAHTKRDGSAFPDVDLSGLNQPAGKWFDSMVSNDYTGDGIYVWYIDKNDAVHFEPKTDSTTPITYSIDLDYPVTEYFQAKITNSFLGGVNFVIFDAGKDLNDTSIYGYFVDATSAARDGFQSKFVAMTDIVKQIKLSNPSISNADLRAQARAQGKSQAQTMVGTTGFAKYSGFVEISGTNVYVPNRIVFVTSAYLGFVARPFRTQEVTHSITENGWFTQLHFAEDEVTIQGVVS